MGAPNTKKRKKDIPYLQPLERKDPQGGSCVASAVLKNLCEEGDKRLWKSIDGGEIAVEAVRSLDSILGNKRGDKAAFLTVPRTKILFYLSLCLGKEIFMDEEHISRDIAVKLEDPINSPRLRRKVKMADIAKTVYGSSNIFYRESAFRELVKAGLTPQAFLYKNKKGEKRWRVGTFFETEGGFKNDQPFIEEIELDFNNLFFENVHTNFAYVPYKIFEIWEKNRTMMFTTLLEIILGDYSGKYKASQAARRGIETEARKQRRVMGIQMYHTREEFEEAQEKAAKGKLVIELRADTLKDRIGRTAVDYETTREARARFWEDLDRAVRDLQAAGIIEKAERVKGSDLIRITLLEHYGSNSKNDLLLLGGNDQ